MESSDLGRLIRTTKEKCPECTHPLQLRARRTSSLIRGIEVDSEQEYKVCSVCDYEFEIPLRDIKKRIVHVDKTEFVKEPVDDKKPRRYPNNASDSKRSGIKTSYNKTNGRSPRSSGR